MRRTTRFWRDDRKCAIFFCRSHRVFTMVHKRTKRASSRNAFVLFFLFEFFLYLSFHHSLKHQKSPSSWILNVPQRSKIRERDALLRVVIKAIPSSSSSSKHWPRFSASPPRVVVVIGIISAIVTGIIRVLSLLSLSRLEFRFHGQIDVR